MKRIEGWHKVFIPNSNVGVTICPDTSFEELRADLDSIESEFGDTHSKFKIEVTSESDWYGGSDTTYYYVYGWRHETDTELELRRQAQKIHDSEVVDREREEYERLAKKFAGKETKMTPILAEGSVIKGGTNRTTQITQRPPPPTPTKTKEAGKKNQ
jgi:hypothetical protein